MKHKNPRAVIPWGKKSAMCNNELLLLGGRRLRRVFLSKLINLRRFRFQDFLNYLDTSECCEEAKEEYAGCKEILSVINEITKCSDKTHNGEDEHDEPEIFSFHKTVFRI